jgi:glycosyltransferase involved in cell wall biosynthesis
MHTISAVIITYNEEKNIQRCIDSVKKIADEILVVDSFSTDNTVAIAKSMGAIVHQEKFRGYIEQKNLALKLSSHHYVLCLDADEALDDVLVNSISESKIKMYAKAYSMNRCTNYCGRFIRRGLWYPDKKLRLFDKRVATWGGINPHDKAILIEPVKIHHLKGDLLHYSYNSIEDHMLQNNKFSSISAQSLYEAGTRTNLFKIILNPVWAFINGYFLRFGFLDGFYGFVIAVNTAHFSFQKHTKLFQLQKKADLTR